MCAYISEVSVLLPEVFLSLVACLLLMLGSFTKSHCFKGASVIVISSLIFAIYLVVYKVPNGKIEAFEHLFKSDELIKSLKQMVLVSSALFVLIYKGQKFEENSMLRSYEFLVILLLGISGMLFMLSANNFLSFYVSLELQSFCLYVLAAFEREDSKSSEAGLKYFVLGSFASGILLFGISLIYGFTGSLDFVNLQNLLLNNQSVNVAIAVIFGIIMLLVGLFFKSSAAPFHMWTPDVYQGSPTIVTSFFAVVAKIAAVGFLLRFVTEVLVGWKFELQPILLLITGASVLFGAIGALKQTNIKRLLAYSSIGHVGYMLLAISSFKLDSSVLEYLIIYVSMTLGAFACIMGIRSNDKAIIEINDLAGLAKKEPLTAMALGILMFSLAGIPPFAGFFAKFYVFKAAIEANLYFTVGVSVVGAIIAAYYYLKIVKIMYLDEGNVDFSVEMTVPTKLIILILVLFNLCYIIYNRLLLAVGF
jgi:NADH-quinone oxidoreductase subunit N